MDHASLEVIESFAEKLLQKRASVTVQTSKLARKGYDVGMLMELVAEYERIPTKERHFEFTKDFAKLGTRHDFGLLVRRL